MRTAKILGISIDLWNVFNGARILVAPLDWGLGHATRCIPIIRALIKHGARPVIGADKAPLALLQQEFPQLEHVKIPGHRVRYSQSSGQALVLLQQVPHMLRSIKDEQRTTERIRNELGIQAIISDQRFGVRSEHVPSVLITHQLFPRSPALQGLLKRIDHMLINKFDACWVMDEEDEERSLAGSLSHGEGRPGHARYIGTQSRFSGKAERPKELFRVVAVLSGPEPQRSIMERIITEQLGGIIGDHLVVQGLINGGLPIKSGNITMAPQMSTQELHSAMQHAELVVARSGYSTLMDLAAIGTRALLIPTPGQPEQEYLATLGRTVSRYMVQSQQKVDIQSALETPSQADSPTFTPSLIHLENALSDLATMLRPAAVPLPSTR